MSPAMAVARGADLAVRAATADDVPAILHLIATSLGSSNPAWGERFWRWKHEENPFGPSPCLLALDEDRLVGLRVFMRWLWRTGNRDVTAVRAVDTVTHPDWRGKGIFSRLTLALVERVRDAGVAMVFNTPNSSSRPGYLKMGWERVGRVTILVRPLRPLRFVAGLVRSRARHQSSMGEPAPVVGGPVAELVADPRLGPLLEHADVTPDVRLRTRRSIEYLSWRYARTPVEGYRAAWRLEGDAGAAVIFRIVTRGALRELRICELVVGPDRLSVRVAQQLVRELCSTRDVDYAAAMAPSGSTHRDVLRPVGFLPIPRVGPTLTVRALRDDVAPDPLRLSSWHLSVGDLELF